MSITIKRLSTGYWHIRGKGPCNWSQPPIWPCDEATLREYAFPEASDEFIRAALAEALKRWPRPILGRCVTCDEARKEAFYALNGRGRRREGACSR